MDKNLNNVDDAWPDVRHRVCRDASEQQIKEGSRQRINAANAFVLRQQRADDAGADVRVAGHERKNSGFGQTFPDGVRSLAREKRQTFEAVGEQENWRNWQSDAFLNQQEA